MNIPDSRSSRECLTLLLAVAIVGVVTLMTAVLSAAGA
jgi:hypothetical protein